MTALRIIFIFIGTFLSIISFPVSAQIYSASTIPDSMKTNANVATRLDDIVLEIKDLDRVDYHVHSVYTILNKNGASKLQFNFSTSKIMSLEELNIRVFDANGIQINKYGKKDLYKVAYMSGLVEDGMANVLEIQNSSYPVTLDVQYEQRFYSTFYYPYIGIDQEGESTENSSLVVKTPIEIGLRYDARNTNIKPEITSDGKYQTYKWTVQNLKADKIQSGTAGYYRKNAAIVLAPNKFKFYNTYGDMSSWKTLGKWAFDLTSGLDKLPAERVQFFQNLVKDAKTDRDKIALVYDYLQQNFRYVSIQLGIGGFKPFPARFTDEKKYGDCKGLSFFMYSVLKTLGIKSHLALINSGYRSEPANPDFPSDPFNHMIICVPQPNDSIWLECTSNTSDFAILGGFTENRYALLLTEEGGVLVPTPKSKSTSNSVRRTSDVSLAEDGSGQIRSTFMAKGDYRELLDNILDNKKDEQKTFVTYLLNAKQPDDFSFERIGNANEGRTTLDIKLEKVPQFMAGSKMFLNSKLYSLDLPSVPKEKRNEDFYLQTPNEQYDSTVYIIPEGYAVDAVPAVVEVHCTFGEYSCKTSFDNDQHRIITATTFVLKNNRVPAASYEEAKQFFDKIHSNQQQKIVIAKR